MTSKSKKKVSIEETLSPRKRPPAPRTRNNTSSDRAEIPSIDYTSYMVRTTSRNSRTNVELPKLGREKSAMSTHYASNRSLGPR